MCLEETKNLINPLVNHIVKLTYAYEWRNFEDYMTVICSVKPIDEKFGYLYFGHPYDIDKKEGVAGEMGLRYEYDDFKIEPVTEDEFNIWKQNYEHFHKSILNEKGYDCCEEDIKNLIY